MEIQPQAGDGVVLDTNIVLDLFVFDDPVAQELKHAVLAGKLRWLATAAMRTELERVLAYPAVARRLLRDGVESPTVMASFDAHARMVAAGAKAPVTCSDADDQIFIDLAVANQAWLVSKDQDVLCMQKRLLTLGVQAQPAIKNIASKN